MAKASIENILASVPARPPRSRLEPYRELIEELRRRRVTFREIAEILEEKCDVRVTRAAVHDFLKARVRTWKPLPQKPVPGVIREIQKAGTTQSMAQDGEITFEFDPSEPLNLGR